MLKVLVISHNVFDYSTSMGKTLSKFFETFRSEEIAQLYVHPEDPCLMPFCSNYYRITDGEAIKSIIKRNNIGKSFNSNCIGNINASVIDSDTSKVYQKGRKRTPFIYIARDTVWKLSNWKNQSLNDWVKEFNPDVVFLASGDYKFIYDIAYYVAELCKKPLITACFDDYYLFNRNEKYFIGKIRQKSFMRTVYKVMSRSACIITVCEPMAKEYNKMFNKPTHVLYTPAEQDKIEYNQTSKRLAYFGSLGLGRDDQLVTIGKCFKKLTGRNIDIYSSETRTEIVKKLIPQNGINFHKAISTDEMKRIYIDCMGVIHTESFDPIIMGRTRFSVSTKIAEALSYGPCLFAYGPNEIASINYLNSNKAAIVVSDPTKLEEGLSRFINDQQNRNQTVERARMVARENHDCKKNGDKLKSWINEAINS